MKELTVGVNDAGQRLDRFLAKTVPLLPASLSELEPALEAFSAFLAFTILTMALTPLVHP